MSDPTVWIEPSPRTRLVGGLNRFGLRLFANLCTPSPQENLFLSPSSIATALAMVHVGAAGETREELATLLEYSLSDEQRSAAFRDLSEIRSPPGVEFHLANRLWGDTRHHFLPEYLDLVERDFGGSLARVEFSVDAEAGRETINAWIAQQTAGRILDLIPSHTLDATTRLVVTNAVYFKGMWEFPFAKKRTKQDDFFMASGRSAKVEMMNQTEDFLYGESDEFQLLELPYRSHQTEFDPFDDDEEEKDEELQSDPTDPLVRYGNSSMLIMLPRVNSRVHDLSRLLLNNGLQCLPRLESREVRVSLPAFQLGSTTSLSDSLQRLGLRTLWSGEANFTRMSDDNEGLCLNEVFHKAFIDVNEAGTEAAAATAFEMGLWAAPDPLPRVDFRANRPFLFMIRDETSGLIHFIGQYAGPEAD